MAGQITPAPGDCTRLRDEGGQLDSPSVAVKVCDPAMFRGKTGVLRRTVSAAALEAKKVSRQGVSGSVSYQQSTYPLSESQINEVNAYGPVPWANLVYPKSRQAR